MASLYNIHLRTGCFCNTGACQKFLSLSNKQVKDNLSAGHVCGDDVDLIEGKPTGSVRISFGYMSNFADARTFLNFIKECFLERNSDHGTASSACLNFQCALVNNIHREQDSTVPTTPNQKHPVVTKMVDDCQVYKPGLLKAVNSLHHPRDLMLEKICIYPIKSCAAFEVSNNLTC